MGNLRVLFDMDGVILDTIGGFIERWKETFPNFSFPPYKEITDFYLENLSNKEGYSDRVSQVWNSNNFFYNLNPLPGALEAIEKIKQKADVAICTSFPEDIEFAVHEKYKWVRDNLNEDWLKRLIITQDKTRVRGNILIDDKPEITGSQQPEWEHVLYSHPWNIQVNHLRRLTWDNWEEVLTELT